MEQADNHKKDDQTAATPEVVATEAEPKTTQRATKQHNPAFSLPPDLINRPKPVYSVKYLSIAFLVIISLTAGFFGGWMGADNHDQSTSLNSPIDTKQTVVSNTSQVISQIAKTVSPSVVSVDVTSQSASPDTNNLFTFGSGTNGSTVQDAGTGIILSSDGLIITNRHVIPDGTTSVSVTLSDGTTYNNVQVVGRTSDSDSLDIAFLKIQDLKGKKLVPVTIGDSSQMQVGDAVVAIGNALGQFQNTVTSGIISGYGRTISASDQSSSTTSENLVDLFQTDAAINEGNSGGPLVNLSGQVIGINTAIAGNAQNIGFSIPINDVVGLIKSVEQTGKLQQPYLGIIYIPITSDVVQQYSLSVSNGAYIPTSAAVGQQTVLSGSPAAQAGLQEGDIITAINGTQINESNSLTSILDQDSVGQVITLSVNRAGKTISIKVTLGTAPTS